MHGENGRSETLRLEEETLFLRLSLEDNFLGLALAAPEALLGVRRLALQGFVPGLHFLLILTSTLKGDSDFF